MHRLAILPLLLAAACSTLSNTDKERLAQYQRNAKLYFEGGKMEQCQSMIEKGLAIDKENYLLSNLKGMVLLRLSTIESGARQDRLLDEALAQLSMVQAWRSPAKHDRYQLLGYGIVLQKVAMRHSSEAARLLAAAARMPPDSVDAKAQQNQAVEHQGLARATNLQARDSLQILLDRGELLLLAHKHLLEVETAIGNYEATFRHGVEFLKLAAMEKELALKQLREATKPEWERVQRTRIDDLRDQEITVRTLLANIHYDLRDFERTVEQLDVVLQLDPSRSADYYNRARALRELGRVDEAKADFRKFLAISPLPASNPQKADAAQALAAQ